MKQVFYICIFLAFSNSLYSQFFSTDKSYLIEIKEHYSYVAAHYDFITYYQSSHFVSTEVSLGKKCNGEKKWHQQYNFPINGFGVHYADFKNQYLGKLIALFYYINIPFIVKPKYSCTFNFSSGLAYHNEIFNEDKNHYNLLISTHINALFNAELNNNFKLTNHLTLTTGVDFAHTSNGLVKYPNLGINMASMHVGLSYFISDNKSTTEKKEMPAFQKSNDLILSFSTGYKDMYQDGKYNIFIFSADFGKHMGYKFRPGIGVDVYYDGSLILNDIKNEEKSSKIGGNIRCGIYVSNYLKFGNVAVMTQPGITIYSPRKIPYVGFQNIGFIYYMTPKLYIRVLLRSYRFTAEFIEWGFAYKIGNYRKGFDFKN